MSYQNSFSYPFRYLYPPHGERIFIPEIELYLNTIKGKQSFKFIVDTGSLVTSLPFSMAETLDIDLSKLEKRTFVGIGGFRTEGWLTKIDIYFAKDKPSINIQASIAKENETPFLLGHFGLLDNLQSWHFDSREKEIVFERI